MTTKLTHYRFCVLLSAFGFALGALAPAARATVTPIAWWRLGENDPGPTNGMAATATTNILGGVLELVGDPVYTTNVSSSALAEVGSTLGLSFGGSSYGTNAVVSTLTNNFGIELWVNPAATNTTACLAYNGDSTLTGWGLYIVNGQFRAVLGGKAQFGNFAAATNTWTHLALVRDSGTATLYVNGVADLSKTNDPNALAVTDRFALAAQPESLTYEHLTGSLDEVRVFSFAPGTFSTNDLLVFSNVVTTASDSGLGSLRTTVADAPTNATITFAPSLSGQTITLTSGQIVLSNNVTIDGSVVLNGIAISGNNSSRVFYVNPSVNAVLNSLTIENGSATSGGGIDDLGTLSMNNCTIVNNTAYSAGSANGGGIINAGTLTLHNCTVANNSASSSGMSVDSGGGIYNAGTLHLTNTIVCGNSAYQGPNIYGSLATSVNNLIDANAMLASLGNYGGSTRTMPPLPGSPAIDAGIDSVTNAYTTDQRGFPRLVGAHVDIGAVESGTPIPGLNYAMVTTTNDILSDGVGGVSLRTAVADVPSGATITFTNTLAGQTITLTNGQIGLSNAVTIDASGLPGGIRIDGNQSSRIFYVNSSGAVVLDSLTIANGKPGPSDSNPSGGGIFINSSGAVTLNECTLSGNAAPIGGAGLANPDGTLTLNQCTLSGNSAGGNGGAISFGLGGGTVAVNQCTLAGNSAGGQGGGIYQALSGSLFTVSNSIVAGNTQSSGSDIYGTGTYTGVNLTNGTPLLAPLGNYGGPTPTMPPLPGSPAIDGCIKGTSFTTDQRGYPRILGTYADLGAVEGVFNPAFPLTSATRLGNGSFQFGFSNLSGPAYSVLASTNVAAPLNTWSNLGAPLESPPGTFQFTDPQATNYPQRVYRVTAP